MESHRPSHETLERTAAAMHDCCRELIESRDYRGTPLLNGVISALPELALPLARRFATSDTWKLRVRAASLAADALQTDRQDALQLWSQLLRDEDSIVASTARNHLDSAIEDGEVFKPAEIEQLLGHVE